MTENKRFTSWGNRIKRNGTLLNIEFKTKSDAKLCCKLLNQMDKEQKEYIDKLDEIFKWHKEHYGKSILDERLEFKSDCEKENEQLKSQRLQWITNQQEVECLTEENEELHLIHGELIDKNNSLHKDVSSLVDEIVNLNSKIEHLEMENIQFKKVFNEIIKQVNVDLDPHYSRYAAIIVFSVQEFEFIRKMMKEELK